ncbi:hypothetical protein [Plesiomonas shigelloides]
MDDKWGTHASHILCVINQSVLMLADKMQMVSMMLASNTTSADDS